MFTANLCCQFFVVTIIMMSQVYSFPKKPIEELSSMEYMHADPKEIAKYGTRLLPLKNESVLDKAADTLDNVLNPLETAGEDGITFFKNMEDLFNDFWHILLGTVISIILILFMCTCVYQIKKRNLKRAAINHAVNKRMEMISSQNIHIADDTTTV